MQVRTRKTAPDRLQAVLDAVHVLACWFSQFQGTKIDNDKHANDIYIYIYIYIYYIYIYIYIYICTMH